MPLYDQDAYAMLQPILGKDAALTTIDVGANVGDTCRRILQVFPRATVHAFEPVPDVFETLRVNTAEQSAVHPVCMAAGDRDGTIDFHVTRNRWCSSALPPSSDGRRFYGDWYDVVGKVSVPIVRLDEWTRRAGIDRVDLLKVDVQGLELAVLRGAAELLRSGGVQAVVCEAQLVREYDGACTFSEIDLFFREVGFTVYQIHEVSIRGSEQQSTCVDAIWLTSEALDCARRLPVPPKPITAVNRLRDAMRCLKDRERSSVALYGAGTHTRNLGLDLDNGPVRIVAIIDDRTELHGTEVFGRPVISPDEAIAAGIDAVILSSDAFEPELWRHAEILRAAGIETVPLYATHAELEALSVPA